MKVKVYMRVAKTHGRAGCKAVATMKPSVGPLLDSAGRQLPTIAFAIMLDIDPAAFRQADQVIAELAVGPQDVTVAAELEAEDG
jgi:hypothetical protein